MQHRPAFATLQLVAVHKTLKIQRLSTDGCTVSVYAFVKSVQFCIQNIVFRKRLISVLYEKEINKYAIWLF